MPQEKQKIGPYTLVKKLARGGFGEVWLAEKQSEFVTKKVAVKLPHDDQVNFDAIRQEATLWEQASGHPNVLPLIDADVYDGQVAIVSEYADGGSLADYLKTEGGRLSVPRAVELAVGILSGLEYLHGKHIVHRDVKPANVLLQNDTPRLADFGISRGLATKDFSSSIVGTESYMSPEAFEGVRSVQTDVWSAGVVLYQMLAGFLPFTHEGNPTETMYGVLLKEPPPLPPDIPAPLAKIVFKALEKDRTTTLSAPRRYQSAAAMRDDLKTFLEKQPFTEHDLLNAASVMPLDKPGEDIATHFKIPVRVKADNFWQKLVRRPLSPLLLLGTLAAFGAILWTIVYLSGRAVAEPPVSANANANNSIADTNTGFPSGPPPISNNDNRGNTNSDGDNSAFDYLVEGNKQFDRKRYDRAIAAYTKAIEINPADYTFYGNRGLAHYQKRAFAEAIEDFNRALELNPDIALIYNNRGVAHEDSGDRERALADYRKAVELDPTDQKSRNNLNKLLK